MSPDTCPKFDSCSAPICPLDPDWNKRVMLRDERVCFYLLKVNVDHALEGVEADTARVMLASELLPYEVRRIIQRN